MTQRDTQRGTRKGCGRLTHVAGTNGGQMRCGATLHDLTGAHPYYCAMCGECDGRPHYQTEADAWTAAREAASAQAD